MIRSTTSDISVSDLTACLGVSFDGRDESSDEIVQESFLLWQSKNTPECSREKLLQCLQQLQGASAFMDKLRERYSQYNNMHDNINSYTYRTIIIMCIYYRY